MSHLPRPDELMVERRKSTDYLLSETHADGQPKARFFMARGFAATDWQAFAAALLRHGREREITSETVSAYGVKYVLRCELVAPDGANPCIDSVWIVEDDAPPRLVTAYPASL